MIRKCLGDWRRGPPNRGDDGEEDGDEAAGASDQATFGERRFVVRAKSKPPLEQTPWVVDILTKENKPQTPEIRIVDEYCGDPLSCKPHAEDHRCENDNDLTDEN